MGRFANVVREDSRANHMFTKLYQEAPQGEHQIYDETSWKGIEQLDLNLDMKRTGLQGPWLVVLAALVCAQILKPNGGFGSGALAYSTVSASLLRNRQTPGWKKLLQQGTLVLLLITQALPRGMNLVTIFQAGVASFGGWYMACLSSFPLYTKALTTAIIGMMGDTGAQMIEERIRSRKEGTPFQFRQSYDRRRGLANAADGFLVTGPLLHFAYNFLETIIPVSGAATGLGATIAALIQVLIDDFILDGIFVAIMFVTTGLGEGYRLRQILSQFRKDYTGAVRASWATSVFLLPCEFVLFRFFPLRFRVLGMNLIDIFWEGMVSYMVHQRRRKGMLEEDDNTITRGETPSFQLA